MYFLTYEYNKRLRNTENYPKAERLLWQPNLQEEKVSEYGSKALRYKWELKAKWIEEFKELVKTDLRIKIRYIF